MVLPESRPGVAIDCGNPAPRRLKLCRSGPVFDSAATARGDERILDEPSAMVGHPNVERAGLGVIGRACEHRAALDAGTHIHPRATERLLVIFERCRRSSNARPR